MKNEYYIIGLMSGSSLDGLDIAYCRFYLNDANWQVELLQGETIAYTPVWKARLKDLTTQSAVVYQQTHVYFGHHCAELVNAFIKKQQLSGKVDFIASHGHTIFHHPELNYTGQIGDGAAMSALTGIPVVADFRGSDIALGGQGAPLVPIGDLHLFASYDYCLNLGGICNCTINQNKHPIAFDIAPCNQLLDFFAAYEGLSYDAEGKIAQSGNINQQLLVQLNQLAYYQQAAPKSLSNKFSAEVLLPIIETYQETPANILATLTAHIAFQIAQALNGKQGQKCLVTGGGAFNTFLIESIQMQTSCTLEIPDDCLVQYKEALVFAYLGLLRWIKQPNTLKEITGATRNGYGGCIYWAD